MLQPYKASVRIDPSEKISDVSPMIFGHFIEFMHDCIDGGMWAQLLKDRGFEQPDRNGDGVSDPWYPVWKTDQAEYGIDGTQPLGRKSLCQRIRCFNHYGGWCGIAQGGLALFRGETYDFSVQLRCGSRASVTVLIRDLEGREYARENRTVGEEWKAYGFSFSSPCDTRTARVEIRLCEDGTVWVDQTSLTPRSAVHGIWRETFRYIRELRPPVIRFPGGCFADCYHWQDGIGERDLRPVRENAHWGGWEDNSFGTDEYMQFCRSVGCEPMICVNFGTGTPQEAADWVEYCNGPADSVFGSMRAKNGHPEPYRIKYWDIGNEMFGDWEIGHCDSNEYVQRYLRFYWAMKEKDNGLCFLACAGDGNFLSQDWNRTILEKLREAVQVLCLHMYAPHIHSEIHDNKAIYYGVAAAPEKYAKILAAAKKSVEEAGEKENPVRLGVTEWNTSYFNDSCREQTLEAAIFNAGMLNLFLKNADSVRICNFSDLVNGWPGGCIRSENGETFGTASYYVIKMYREASPVETLRAESDSPVFDTPEKVGHVDRLFHVPYLDAAVAKNAVGDILVFAVNRHLEKAVSLNIDCGKAVREAEVSTITSANTWQTNSFGKKSLIPKITRVLLTENGLTLPPHSVNLIRIPDQ